MELPDVGPARDEEFDSAHAASRDLLATQAAYRAQLGDAPLEELLSRSSQPYGPYLAPAPRANGPAPRAGGVRGFVRRYGWRAYALPLLIVITVVALTTSGEQAHPGNVLGETAGISVPASSGAAAPPTATGDHSLKTDDPGANSQNTALQPDALPAGVPYTVQGTGKYTVLPGSSAVIGTGTLHKYTIEVENGITGIDLDAFATTVQTVLSDPRSWSAGGKLALQRVASGSVDFRVTLTSSLTVRSLCGYETPVETSCFVRAGTMGSNVNRVVLNDSRWVRGDAAYIGDLDAYREYMVNHETGHALGHLHAHDCLADGLAPAMMQQTIGLKSMTGQLCQANPWPYPPGAADAPGAEAADTTNNSEFNLQNE